MHHQGIFRVPGAQADINAYKLQFERGLFSLSFRFAAAACDDYVVTLLLFQFFTHATLASADIS